MFCQSCGSPLTQGLVYCNRCGARVASQALSASAGGPPPEKLAEVLGYLTMATGFVSLGGLAFVYFLITRLMSIGFDDGRIIPIVFFSLAAVVTISVLLVSQLSRVLNAYLGSARVAESRTPELAAPTTAQLEAPREPASSVTDHTTRTFDPAYAEKGKRAVNSES